MKWIWKKPDSWVLRDTLKVLYQAPLYLYLYLTFNGIDLAAHQTWTEAIDFSALHITTKRDAWAQTQLPTKLRPKESTSVH